jgi:hypothetical protein
MINEEQFDRTTSSLVYDRMTADYDLLPSNNNITHAMWLEVSWFTLEAAGVA